jgi:hypothetical protein
VAVCRQGFFDVVVEFWQGQVPAKEDVRAPVTLAYEKRYACVECAKIRGLGLCPFQEAEEGLLAWCEQTMTSAVRDIEDILGDTKCPSQRCGRVFALRYARSSSERCDQPRVLLPAGGGAGLGLQ